MYSRCQKENKERMEEIPETLSENFPKLISGTKSQNQKLRDT